MTMQIKNAQGEWVDGDPVVGKPYRQKIETGKFRSLDTDGNVVELPKYAYVEGSEYVPQEAVADTKVSVKAFLLRIDPEMVEIDLASIDDPSTNKETRVLSATVRKLMRLIQQSQFIDLKDPILVTGLNKLVQFGLLTEQRKDEILNTPVAAHERP